MKGYSAFSNRRREPGKKQRLNKCGFCMIGHSIVTHRQALFTPEKYLLTGEVMSKINCKTFTIHQCFSTWNIDSQGGREPFLEGSGVDILFTQLYYICLVRVLDGVVEL